MVGAVVGADVEVVDVGALVGAAAAGALVWLAVAPVDVLGVVRMEAGARRARRVGELESRPPPEEAHAAIKSAAAMMRARDGIRLRTFDTAHHLHTE